MRAYRVATGRRIQPFGDLVRDLHVVDQTIAEWQAEACKACGLELVDVAAIEEVTERPAIAFFDDHFFTEMAFRQFVAAVMSAREDACLAVPDSAVQRAWRVLDDEGPFEDGAQRFDVFFVTAAPAGASLAELRRRARPSVLKSVERTTSLRLPADKGSGEAPLSARVVAHVRHWLHVLRLSQLGIGVRLLDRLRTRPGLLLRLRFLRGRRDPWALARRVNFVHPTARVHPTADLECAVIGPGAIVHAHAHVHRSVLGAGVEIGDHAAVVGCALAERVQVLRASYFALSASMPGSTLASYKAQLSLFGREVFLTSSAWLIDAKLEGDVRIEHDGRLVSLGTPYLGVCVGHRATLGAQVTILAGRAVPNGVTIVAPPGQFAAALPALPEGTLATIRNGRLEPV